MIDAELSKPCLELPHPVLYPNSVPCLIAVLVLPQGRNAHLFDCEASRDTAPGGGLLDGLSPCHGDGETAEEAVPRAGRIDRLARSLVVRWDPLVKTSISLNF